MGHDDLACSVVERVEDGNVSVESNRGSNCKRKNILLNSTCNVLMNMNS